ncbi:MAG: hypothetical protein JXA89_10425 [Anaerolineae bacterium]|nr:hypothetical protein [Anaerolineae bacterium]
MNVIRSPRLDLVSMGSVLLEALLAGNRVLAAQIGGFQIPDDLAIGERTLQMRLQQIRADPGVQSWLLRAIVIRESRTMCGRSGRRRRSGKASLDRGGRAASR